MGLRSTTYGSLALEQVPKYRGTMMSLSQFSANVANAFGIGLGGLLIVTFDYGYMGYLGILSIIATFIFHFFIIDPTQPAKI